MNQTTDFLAFINTTKRALRQATHLPITDRRGRILAEILPDADGFFDRHADAVRLDVETGLRRVQNV